MQGANLQETYSVFKNLQRRRYLLKLSVKWLFELR
jgi:hypothetical protein